MQNCESVSRASSATLSSAMVHQRCKLLSRAVISKRCEEVLASAAKKTGEEMQNSETVCKQCMWKLKHGTRRQKPMPHACIAFCPGELFPRHIAHWRWFEQLYDKTQHWSIKTWWHAADAQQAGRLTGLIPAENTCEYSKNMPSTPCRSMFGSATVLQ